MVSLERCAAESAPDWVRQTSAVSSRKVGVEEELMLVDPDTGELMSVSRMALRSHRDRNDVPATADQTVEHELFLHQIETQTEPCESLAELDRQLRGARRLAGEAAETADAAAVAVPTPVLATVEPTITAKPRYLRIRDTYGEISRQALVGAMHVHVEVDGDEEGVGVLDRIRVWLPALLALSANSPFWQGADTGYASWRSQIWTRWPSAGTGELFGDVATYRSTVATLIEWGAALDEGMIYLDARMSTAYPTVEIRVADVCTEVDDALLVAALARALVHTAAGQWSQGRPPTALRADLLRAAYWRAARFGVSGKLVDPVTRALAPIREVFARLIGQVGDALDEAGDRSLVMDSFERLLARGSGDSRQRAVAQSRGSLQAVVRDLRERTEASWRS